MQRAMGGIINNAAAARGYLASDPRTYNTLFQVGKTTAATAAAAGAATLVAGSAPAWGTILAIAAVSSAVSYALPITLDSGLKWAFGTGSTPVTATLPASPTNSIQVAPGSGALTCASPVSINWSGCTAVGDTVVYIQMSVCPGQIFTCGARQVGETFITHSKRQLSNWGYTVLSSSGNTTLAPSNMSTAVSNIPSSQLTQPVNYEAMALIVNNQWKNAAQTAGYDGVPYLASQPVTAANVQAWATSNPASYPTVAALVAPVTNGVNGFSPSTTTSPSSSVSPATATTAPTATNGSTQPLMNLGADPNVTLQTPSAPTASTIFAPFMDIASPFINLQLVTPVGVCPEPVFDLFGKQIKMDQHCTVMEGVRSTLSAMMTVVFLLAAFFIVFSA
jgi:hypothetical protein